MFVETRGNSDSFSAHRGVGHLYVGDTVGRLYVGDTVGHLYVGDTVGRLCETATGILHIIKMPFNPSAWSDEPCSSCCTLSLIGLYLDKLGSKCNQAASRLFVKELALL